MTVSQAVRRVRNGEKQKPLLLKAPRVLIRRVDAAWLTRTQLLSVISSLHARLLCRCAGKVLARPAR